MQISFHFQKKKPKHRSRDLRKKLNTDYDPSAGCES